MASRLKEDEKNEKILRGLSKLPANRRCINCNSQGTQYVCTNFATFICINCSGIHREFTHRVKSISMAKFTAQEITALQEGGNERAKGIYFKGWDFERQSLPDSSDIDKLRDFIKHVYVDQRFVGERNVDKTPAVKVEKETLNQVRSQDSEQSPKKDKAAPVNETNNSSSATCQESMGSTSRVVKDDSVIVPPAKILGPPKLDTPSTPRTPTPVAPVQSIETTSNIKDRSTQNPPEVKLVPTISLIDFDSDPEPVPRQQTATANQISDVGWASFDTQKPSFTQAPSSSANNLETSQIHQHAPRPVPRTAYSKMPVQNNTHQNNVSLFPTVQSSNAQLNGSPAVGPTIQSWGQPVARNIHTNSIVSNHASPASTTPHFINRPGALPMDVTPLQATASPAVPSSGRKALPEDLFSMVYAPSQAPMPGWQSAPRMQMVYAMQYATPSQAPLFAQPAQSSNPFDVGSVPKLAHSSTFPSMSSMQGALPNLNSGNPNNLSRATSLVSFGAQWAPQPSQPSYPLTSHPSQYSAQPYVNNMVHQIPNNTYYPGNQVQGGYSAVNGGYGLSGMNPQQLFFKSPQPGNAGPFPSVGGNPFA
ncbi:hypothetical protein LUZ63_013608 [Rhynchospora breviuscula]|uniref:Arf-GAP domain-containing protein n=1 Tax=Rhynchospora breviuscula TaxID=2022672 RepID=A0A9Q0C8W4_9POAL|nr:hypothetical protein LUZ63_013608 [Rhynchospora breviuscula]